MFNKDKCQILYLEWGIPGCPYRLGGEMLESSAVEMYLNVLVDGKLSVSGQAGGPAVCWGASGIACQ